MENSVAKPAVVRPVAITVKVSLTALAVPEPGGGYSIVVPSLPGCLSDAATIEEAHANVVEAAEGWLAAAHDQNAEAAVQAGLEDPGQ